MKIFSDKTKMYLGDAFLGFSGMLVAYGAYADTKKAWIATAILIISIQLSRIQDAARKK